VKNVLMKFAGLFVERVPVDEQGNPVPKQPRPSAQAPHPAAQPRTGAVAQPTGPPQHAIPVQPSAAMPPGAVPLQTAGAPIQPVHAAPAAGGQQPIAVALRAWVPQEYAAHLAPHGLHVIAAGGSVTSEQARGWGATVLVISAECLGSDVHLLQQPQLPTVFITPQPVMIPDVPGVVQVQEPLRASDVAQAVRDAAAAFAAARR
jgi:hypothetical protein